MKIAPAGDRALLLHTGALPAADLHAFAAAARQLPGVVACVTGQQSLLVVYGGTPDPRPLHDLRPAPLPARAAQHHHLTVSFHPEHAPDLEEFLRRTHLTWDHFAARLGELKLVVRFIGFRGGFGYLDGWPPEWSMPRRPTSRARVREGTFAIAGEVAGFYPLESPGGWNLLGRTGRNLAHALAPGDLVTIQPTLENLPERPEEEAAPAGIRFPLELVSSPLTRLVTGEDWSATLYGHPPGGPFDDVAAAAANRAVGNPAGAPLLEAALTGPRAVARRDVVVSLYGAETGVLVEGKEVDDPRRFAMREGEELRTGRLQNGMRVYLAAGEGRGELTTLRRGEERLTIEALPGPHATEIEELLCEVTPQLDRVGIRMQVLEPRGLRAPADLPSCGMLCGTLQLHPDGSVVAMGPDHPVTGGYLQPMTVLAGERWKLAQLAPGDRVRFRARRRDSRGGP